MRVVGRPNNSVELSSYEPHVIDAKPGLCIARLQAAMRIYSRTSKTFPDYSNMATRTTRSRNRQQSATHEPENAAAPVDTGMTVRDSAFRTSI